METVTETMIKVQPILNPDLISESTQPANTYLKDRQIELLKSMFCDEDKYRYYMKTLWILRELAEKACMDGPSLNTSNPNFPLLETINELIGSLLPDDGSYFDVTGNMIKQ